MRVIGMMSGTSCDGIDAAAADLEQEDGTLVLTPLGMVTSAYDRDLRAELAAALPPAATTMADVCRLDTGVGRAFAAAAVRADAELCAGRADLVVSHGQTVYHWTESGRVRGTLQIGEPAWIAEATGRPVVSGLRTRDVAAGGQGAPLVGIVDLMWLRGRPGRPAALNLGGIANLTVVREDAPLAFDTGPGNALLDAAATALTGGRLRYDPEGAMAARGRVCAPLLRTLLAEPYYRLPAPKTTGKELFHWPYLRAALDALPPARRPSPQDVLATAVRLTAVTVADAVRAAGADEVVASGGGTRNPVLMDALRRELGPATALVTSDGLGLPSAAKEAYAFAVLGHLTVRGLPATVPACTGARHASLLGSLTPGRDGFPPVPAGGRAPRRLVVRPPAE